MRDLWDKVFKAGILLEYAAAGMPPGQDPNGPKAVILRMIAKTQIKGPTTLAFNEVSILRHKRLTSNVRILVDGIVRIPPLRPDGLHRPALGLQPFRAWTVVPPRIICSLVKNKSPLGACSSWRPKVEHWFIRSKETCCAGFLRRLQKTCFRRHHRKTSVPPQCEPIVQQRFW